MWVECRGRPGKAIRWTALAVLLLLIAGRYGDITAPALFGRRIDLYWDLRHAPSVAAMFVEAAPWWRIAGLVTGIAVLIAALFLAVRYALGAVLNGLAFPALRRGAGLLAAATLVLYAAGLGGVRTGAQSWFALPVTPVYARQAAFLVRAAQAQNLAVTPMTRSDLGAVGGADIFTIFFESYGAVVFERPQLYAAVAAELARFDEFLRRSGWRAASASGRAKRLSMPVITKGMPTRPSAAITASPSRRTLRNKMAMSDHAMPRFPSPSRTATPCSERQVSAT